MSEREKPSYYAIIPATVRYDDKLSSTAKLIYGEITALSDKEGYCWASNDFFSSVYGITKTQISTIINQLEKRGYIWVKIFPEQGNRRIIGIRENLKTYTSKVNDPSTRKLGDLYMNITSKVDSKKKGEEYTKCHEQAKPLIDYCINDDYLSGIKNLDVFCTTLIKNFEDVDFIKREFKKMTLWLIANPKKQKSNYGKFVLGWLNRSYDGKGGKNNSKFTGKNRGKSNFEGIGTEIK